MNSGRKRFAYSLKGLNRGVIATMPFYRVSQSRRKCTSNPNHLRSRCSIRLGPYGPRLWPACGREWQYLAIVEPADLNTPSRCLGLAKWSLLTGSGP
jgi:hypothetical protein